MSPISLTVPSVKVIGSTAIVPISIRACDVIMPINIQGSHIQVPVDIQGSYIMVPIDIQAQYMNLAIDIVAQSVGNISVDLAAQTIDNININLAAQTAEAITFNIGAASARLNFNFTGQTEALMLAGDWATKEAQDFHLQAKYTGLAGGATATLITIVLASNIEHWLYVVHISGTQNGEGYTRANRTGGYDWLSHGFFGANSGYIKSWEVPVKRRRDVAEGITEITVTVKNLGTSAGDFIATLDGLKVVDIAVGEKVYTTQAEWEACITKVDISTTESPGDVVLAYQE